VRSPNKPFDTSKLYPWDDELEERFLAKFEEATSKACWLWTAATLTKGYGLFGVRSQNALAHRVQFQRHHGYLPEVVCHTCDNPGCVNPAHLFAGDQTTNMSDCKAKGRSARGRRHGHALLTETQALFAAFEQRPAKDVARELEVVDDTIRELRAGRTWSWLTGIEADDPRVFKEKLSKILTETQVLDIAFSTDSLAAAALRVGCGRSQVSRIRRGESWSHLTGIQKAA